jgi:hypothetical protein
MLLDDIKELPISKWGRMIDPNVAKYMKAHAHRARCYVFDRDASFKLGRFIRECPDVIADQVEFAIEPYPVTYVEMEVSALKEGIGRTEVPAAPTDDFKLGYFSSEGRTAIMINNKVYQDTVVGVAGFSNRDADLRNALYAKASNPDFLKEREHIQLLGSTFNDLSLAQRNKITDVIGGTYIGVPELDGQGDLVANLLHAHQGDARNYIAALLLLQQKKAIALTEKPAHRTMYRGKSRPFMAHNVVTITLDSPVQIRKAMSSGSGETRRAHEVPAHYAHRHGTRNCEHTWQKREDEENHWDCTKCGRFRYMRRHHMRGDASKGFVKKSYNVTTEDAK